MRPSFRRVRLSTLLVSINIALLLLAVAAVAFVAVRLLQQLADEQARARVAQASLNAQSAISRTGDDLRTAAQVLAERPSLRRYLSARDRVGLVSYLEQYRISSHLDGCAVFAHGQVLAQTGRPIPWDALSAHLPQSDIPFLQQQDGNPLIEGAWAGVPEQLGMSVVAVDILDGAFARRVSAQVTLPIAILERQAARAALSGPAHALLSGVLSSGRGASAYLSPAATYVAIQPLRSPSGDVVGIVETDLPATGTLASVRQFIQTLLVLVVGVAALAAFASVLVGRLIGRPLRRLSAAAANMGNGDLTTPVQSEAGKEIGALATTLEETRQRLLGLTERLRQQQAEAQAILASIVEGIYTVDRSRRIRYLNPQAAAMLGVSPGDAIGRFCGDVLHPRPIASEVRPCEERCPIVHARFRGGTSATEHLRLADGAERTVVVTSAAPTDGQQVQVLRDETEVEVTRRLRDTVLANISHEFKTPLAAQLASIELLLDQLPELTAEEIERLVVAQQRGALRLTQLIDNLLESVRIEVGKDRIRRHAVALDKVVEDAVEMLRPLIAQRGQDVRMELPSPLPPVAGDAHRLTQVFVNLLANANKFAPPHTTIQIGGDRELDHVTLWLEDAGPGHPDAGGQDLFERFVRASGDEPEQSGMGLGLWIVRSIVERHGGHVEVRGIDEGSGTRICVTLPVEGGAA